MKNSVLLVDDEAGILDFTSKVLRGEGYEVSTAMNGLEALQYIVSLKELNTKLPDIMVLDMKMPAMSGLELLIALDRHGIQVPFIMLTANADKDLLVRLLRPGYVDYLEKPISAEHLTGAVSRAIANLTSGNYRIASTGEKRLHIEETDGWHLLTPAGDIDGNISAELRSALAGFYSTGSEKYRFDFRHVNDIDVVGLRVLYLFARMLHGNGGSALLAENVTGNVRLLFEKTELGSYFTLK